MIVSGVLTNLINSDFTFLHKSINWSQLARLSFKSYLSILGISAIQQLSKELEQLKKENTELKSKQAATESRMKKDAEATAGIVSRLEHLEASLKLVQK